MTAWSIFVISWSTVLCIDLQVCFYTGIRRAVNWSRPRIVLWENITWITMRCIQCLNKIILYFPYQYSYFQSTYEKTTYAVQSRTQHEWYHEVQLTLISDFQCHFFHFCRIRLWINYQCQHWYCAVLLRWNEAVPFSGHLIAKYYSK